MTKSVFISYSTDDSAVAEETRDGLEAAGIPCWMAPRDIAPGKEYGPQIIEAIESCAVLVLLLSESSNSSRFVINEVERAVAKGKVVIPVRVHDVQPSRSLEFFISNAQWIDAWQLPLSTQIEVLATAIRNHLSTGAQEERSFDPIIWPPISSSIHVATSPRTNLPKPYTPFVGRAVELAAILKQLHDPACRLLTLLGQGGMGKTRLALESARHIFAEMTLAADGVFFVALDALATPEQIAPAILMALGLPAAGQSDPHGHLLTFLGEKQLLLVLDNFEHLLEGAILMADILAAAPNVKLLVTSRAALALQEEWLHPVAGMDLPATNAATLAETQSASAVQFFMQCGRRARPNFSLADEVESVVQLCRLVDGTPLALELAAAWLRSLTCAQIATELQGSLDLLSTTMRNVPQRHRSLQAVFDQSWQLLDTTERSTLCQFVVFEGGFDWAAVKAVSGVTLPMLTALVDRSWLQVGEEGRYDLHPLVRSYLLDKFNTEYASFSAETPDQVRDRHSRYYAALDGGDSVQIGEREVGNVRAGWLHATQQLDLATLLHYMTQGNILWVANTNTADELLMSTLTRMREVEVTANLNASQQVTAMLLYARAQVLNLSGLPQQAEKVARECLAYLDRFPDADCDLSYVGDALSVRNAVQTVLVWILITQSRLHEADGILYGLLAMAQTLNHDSWQLALLHHLAYSADERGIYTEAAAYLHQGLGLSVEERYKYHLFLRLAIVSYETGKYELAAEKLKKGEVLLDFVHPTTSHLEQQVAWARLDIVAGDLAAARARCLAVLPRARDLSAKNPQLWALNELGRIALLERAPTEATGFFQQAAKIADGMGRRKEQARARVGLGHTAIAQGKANEAVPFFHQAIQIAWPEGILPEVLAAIIGLAQVENQGGNRPKAVTWLGMAVAHTATHHHVRLEAQALLASLTEDGAVSPARLDEIVAIVLASAESSVQNKQ